MIFHTEIRHPDDPPPYKERQIIPSRNEQHAGRMERDLRLLHLELLKKRRLRRLDIPA